MPKPMAIAIRDEQHYFATVSEVRALAERIQSVGDAKALADKARAAQVWAERARFGQEQVNLAAIARLWAERRAGELLAEIRGDAGRLPNRTLSDGKVSEMESHRFQRLAAIPADEFQDSIEAAAEEGAVSASRVMAVHYSSATPEWETPQELFDELNVEFGFTIDVCATADNAKTSVYYDAERDGLSQDWRGVCWMNPPYGDAIVAWVRKAWEAAERGATVVCLVPARVDTGWWWNYCRHGEIRFLRGRLRFGGGDTAAPFPSAVVVFPRAPRVVWWERNG